MHLIHGRNLMKRDESCGVLHPQFCTIVIPSGQASLTSGTRYESAVASRHL